MRRLRRSGARAALGAVLVAGACAAPAAANDAGSISRTSGSVTAVLEWDRADFGIANPRLGIMRGPTRYDITIADVCSDGCILIGDEASTTPEDSIVKVADLDGDGEPEVLVDTFSGGAHCCLTTRVLTWDGTAYGPTDIEWRDGGYALRDADGDGRPELVGYDPVFDSAFTAHAASMPVPMVLRLDHGTPANVTRAFPALLRADAREQLTRLRNARRGDEVRGILAAYVAEQYLLGRGATGVKEIDRQRKLKRVSAGFKTLLLKKLKAWHYR